MTRETKIGLLVGLAFIIVIGILLSDHFSSTTEPPRAPLAQAGDTVRQGVGLPSNPQPQPPITIVPPVQVAPIQPVPTREELNKPTPPSVVNPPRQQTDRMTPVDPQLRQIAQQVGEELVPAIAHRAEPAPQPQQREQLAPPAPPAPVALTAGREYKAEEGDSLSRMASKFYGTNSKANRQAIIDANPSLKADPNKVIVGRTYAIPAPSTPGNAGPAIPAPQPVAMKTRQQPTASPEYWYTVKDNDNLWKIAYEQLGNGNAWTAIKELNKDALKGADTVQPNMRLRLPAKPMASAR